MGYSPKYLLDALLVLPLVLGVESLLEKRKCYQCEVSDLSLCTDEYLLPCPEIHFDSCMTRVSKTKSDGVWYHKSCALAPCSLRDDSQSKGLGLDYCDRGKEEYDCYTCCKEDGCNRGGGSISRPLTILIATAAVLSVMSWMGNRICLSAQIL